MSRNTKKKSKHRTVRKKRKGGFGKSFTYLANLLRGRTTTKQPLKETKSDTTADTKADTKADTTAPPVTSTATTQPENSSNPPEDFYKEAAQPTAESESATQK